MVTPATVKQLQAAVSNELLPRAVYDPTEVAIVTSALNAWFPGDAAMIEGAAAGSILPIKWKSLKDLQGLQLAGSKSPIVGYDSAIKKNYLQFGYGGSLARRTNTLKALKPAAAGSGYVSGDTVTLSNGVVVTYTGTTGVFTAAGFTITNFGTFSAQPAGVLTQVSSSGAGTGVTMVPEFSTDCGSLALAPSPPLLSAAAFTIITVFRCPVVGGVAGADPGGFIAGSQLNESEQYNTAGNARYWGLRLGSPNLGLGRLSLHLLGDAVRVDAPSGTDYRDGAWHVVMGAVVPGGTSHLYVDGADIGTRVGSLTLLNTTTGALNLRVGAAGLPGDGPTGGAALDVGSVMIVPLDLTANDTLRKLIGNYLLAKWKGGGSWA